MERRKTHPQGPEFSRIITGAWRWQSLSTKDIEKLILTSIEEGITTFDHADIYGDYSCEELFGNALALRASLRTNIQLVSKCGIKLKTGKKPDHSLNHYDNSKEHIINSVDQTLKNLQTDYLDLLLLHRPSPLINPEEVAEAFNTLKKNGKVLHFGVSNYTVAQFEMLQQLLSVPLVTNQIELSLFNPKLLFDGIIETLMKYQIAPMIWSPLGGGKFFGDGGSEIQNQMNSFAGKYDCTLSQLALAWLLKHPSGMLPILGTTKPERIEEGARAVNINLDRQDWFEMLKRVRGKDVD